MRYRIYWNLHKRTYSILHKVDQDGKPSAAGRWKLWRHADTFVLDNVETLVGESSRQRVLHSGHKNVHAYLCAEYVTFPGEPGFDDVADETWSRVTYNPRTDDTFMTCGHRFEWAPVVRCTTKDGHSLVEAAAPVHVLV